MIRRVIESKRRYYDTLISISEIFDLASVRVPAKATATSPGQNYRYMCICFMFHAMLL